MIHAYREIYLERAMTNLGVAFDYAVNDCKDYLYEPGSTVMLRFPAAYEDVSYAFDVVGADHFDADYDPQKEDAIQFEMSNSQRKSNWE